MKNKFLIISLIFVLITNAVFAEKKTVEKKAIDKKTDTEKINENDDTPYLVKLTSKKQCTYEDGVKMVFLLKNNLKMFDTNFKNQLKFLRENNIIYGKVNKKGKLMKGCLARMIMRMLKIKGGFMYTITGWTRYAYKELIYKGLLPAKGSYLQGVNGRELSGIIDRATHYYKRINNIKEKDLSIDDEKNKVKKDNKEKIEKKEEKKNEKTEKKENKTTEKSKKNKK